MNSSAIIFARVSTVDRQDYQRQIDDLTSYCEKRNLSIVDTIAEKISGAKTNEDREGIKKLLKQAHSGKFDTVCVTEISRLGRNPFEVQKVIEELSALNISIHIQTLGLQTLDDKGKRSPMVDLMVAILSQFARIERDTIIERVRSGMARAKSIGKCIHRPVGSTENAEDFLKKYRPIIRDLKSGISLRKIGRIHSVSLTTVQKVKRAMVEA